MMKPITAQRLRDLLAYCPETGVFTNRVTRGARAIVGAVAGSRGAVGYVEIRVDRVLYYAHRLAWLYMTGEWPSEVIDHRDADRANNRWSNLRSVTRGVNQENRRVAARTNKSGFLGVAVDKRRGGHRATIVVRGKQKHIGSFESAADAHQAYVNAKRSVHEGCTL